MMRHLLLATTVCIGVGWSFHAHAQVPTATVVSTCGAALGWGTGTTRQLTVDANGNLCSSASGGGAGAVFAPGPVTATDKGGTITLGGTQQTAIASNASRKGGWIQNPCNATEDLFVSTTTSATVNGAGNDADLAPCGSYSLMQSGLIIQTAVSVIAATTGHRWIGKETQ